MSPPGPGFAWAALVGGALLVSLVLVRRVLAHTRRALVPFGIALETYAVLGDAPGCVASSPT